MKCWIHWEPDCSVCVQCNCTNWEYLGYLSCMRSLQVISLSGGLGRHTTFVLFTTLSPKHPEVGDKRSPIPLFPNEARLRELTFTSRALLPLTVTSAAVSSGGASCRCLGSYDQTCIKHLILQTKPSVRTCSTNGNRKLTVYILWHRCCQVCLPVPSGMRVNVAASHRFGSAENVQLKKSVIVCISHLKKTTCTSPSALQGWVLWRMGPGATTTTSASTAPTASMVDVSSCVSSSWLLWRMTRHSTISRCSVGKSEHSLLSIFNDCNYFIF